MRYIYLNRYVKQTQFIGVPLSFANPNPTHIFLCLFGGQVYDGQKHFFVNTKSFIIQVYLETFGQPLYISDSKIGLTTLRQWQTDLVRKY